MTDGQRFLLEKLASQSRPDPGYAWLVINFAAATLAECVRNDWVERIGEGDLCDVVRLTDAGRKALEEVTTND